MKSLGRRLFTAGVLSVAALSAIAVPASAERSISELALPPFARYSGARGINDSGVIVGWAYVEGLNQPAKWTPDGRVTALAKPPNADSGIATAINSGGTIVGSSFGNSGTIATQWAPNGAVRVLAGPPGYPECDPEAINDSGVIVGICGTGADVRAVRWNPNGSVAVLTTPPGYRASRAHGINSAGVIVGSLTPVESGTFAVRWNPDGTVADLRNLPNGVVSEATGINDSGLITGTITVSPPGIVQYAIRWNADGSLTTLPTPANAPQKHGVGHKINADGSIIGETMDAANRYVPAVWSSTGTLTVLRGLTADSDDARALGINKRNVIVGNSDQKAVQWRGAVGIPCTVKPFCGS